MTRETTGYSATQVAAHWLVVLLVVFQLFGHDGMEAAWEAFERGQPTPDDERVLAYLHIAAGVSILLLMLTRLYLRLTRGVPRPPRENPQALRLLAEGVHWSIYALLILIPLAGATAWFGGVEPAADAHVLLKNALLVVVGIHVLGALYEHFIARTDVLMRMLRPQRTL